MPIDPPFSAERVRQSFLEFFAERAHRVVPSAPVFPQDDPTLLFTNAGMNQFKDVFLGTGSREYSRAADTQKCIRVQGKHNDLEEVGVDTYHHTFFEMLGNWSFGDYFKRKAIRWAWELLTDVWGLPKERLWATVFSGDAQDGLPADEECAQLWREETDIAPERILLFDRRDNFWEMGATGPCGPCTEIHFDRGGPGEDPRDGADPALGVNAGNERFIELWNLVFIQFNRRDDGQLVELPKRHVDTGMGLERVVAVLQGHPSNYDTDLFGPIFAALQEHTGKRYGVEREVDVAFRVCADHVRAVSSALGDGALPSNEGRGYVLRRLIRRASRYGLQTLGTSEPFLYQLVPSVVEVLGSAFPEIAARAEHIQVVLRSEESSFRRTLERGLVQFEKLAAGVPEGTVLDGAEAFELYATYGFPRDLVELMARERDLSVDSAGWEAARELHSSASRAEEKFRQVLSAEELSGLAPTCSTYHEAGDAALSGEARVLKLLRAEERADRLVLDTSPFYAESGGQVGDRGIVAGSGLRFEVTETRKIGEVVVHLGRAQGEAAAGSPVQASVDATGRAAIRGNHTATHLLHRALKVVLGEHVTQQGSYVGPDRLRFDFANPGGVSAADLARVERLVQEEILRNTSLATSVEEPEAAVARGAVALFGEKYGERVRVVEVGDFSCELCGGTHVAATGEIGPFAILLERAIQAGVRRIEAVTGRAALEHFQETRDLLGQVASRLRVPPAEVPERVEGLMTQLQEARKAASAAASAAVAGTLDEVRERLERRGEVLVGAVDLPEHDGAALRELAERIPSLGPDLAVALLGREGKRVPFSIVCRGRALDAGLAAGALAKGLKTHLGGGGGGRPEVAQGQGNRPDGVPAALAALDEAFAEAL